MPGGRFWSASDVRLLKKLYNSHPASEVAKQLNRSLFAVRIKAHNLRLQGTRGRHWSASELGMLRELYGRQPTSELARQMNRSLQSVYAKALSLGLKGGLGFRRGEEAAALRAQGLTLREIAERMGVKETSVYVYLYLNQHPEKYEKLKEALRGT